MESNWDFYFNRVNDALSSIYVDQGFYDVAPLADKPFLILVSVYMNAPREDGLSSNEEAPKLFAIEDALSPAVQAATGGVMVGRVTGARRREFYFYGARKSGVDAAVLRAMQQFRDYRFEITCKKDTEWTCYLEVLYPSPRDQQRMSNRHVLEQLKEKGDRHELERPIDHMMYFKTRAGSKACKDALIAEGYRIDSEDVADEAGVETPFSLGFSRTDHVEWNRINEISLELFELAEKHDGTYDGWGCEVKDEE